jgi:hypothetical protein
MDWYRKFLNAAKWDWLECKFCHPWHKRLKKDRTSGRAEKRAARQIVRKEIKDES